MTEISRRLRAARERAGLSLEDISATTKIRVPALQAMEQGQFERLPGDFYARAFLKVYARELHLPAEEIVQGYDASRQGAVPQPDAPEVAPPRARTPRQWSWPAPWRQILSMPLQAPVAVTVAVVLLAVMLVRNRPVADRPHEAGAVGTSGVAAPAAAAPATRPPEAAPEKLILEIHPSGPIWVTGAADGKRVLYRLIAPGERVRVEARNDLAFRIGNAVAFNYTINGVPGKPLGGPDEIREFRITRENYRTFHLPGREP